jgi:hypothetical protein
LFAFSAPLRAQNRAVREGRDPLQLQPIARRAGTIFSGRVVSVVPSRSETSGRVATVTVSFQVEQGIRGVKPGQIFSFREWAALWSAGERYRVGQRLLLFLYAPSALGLTSPVGGDSGRLAVDAQGRVLPPSSLQLSAFPAAGHVPRPPIRVRDVASSIRRMREE